MGKTLYTFILVYISMNTFRVRRHNFANFTRFLLELSLVLFGVIRYFPPGWWVVGGGSQYDLGDKNLINLIFFYRGQCMHCSPTVYRYLPGLEARQKGKLSFC